jgi:hypothetical protein
MIIAGHTSIPVVTKSGPINLGRIALTVFISTLIYKYISHYENPINNYNNNNKRHD